MIFKWGTGEVAAHGFSEINLNRPDMPNLYYIFSVLITPKTADLGKGSILVAASYPNGFNVRSSYGEHVAFYYLAIGRQQ